MQTRCPNCDILYRIDQDELTSADGQVRCYRCETVFDAYEQQIDTDTDPLEGLFDDSEPADSDLAAETPPTHPSWDEPSSTDPLDSELDLESYEEQTSDAESELNLIELADSLRTQPRHNDFADELNLDDIDLDESDTPLGPDLDQLAEDELELERDLAPPAEQHERNLSAWLGKLLLILLLCTVAAAQLAWQQRAQLLKDPDTRRFAEHLCQYAGCKLPLAHTPAAYQIVQRKLGPAPGHSQALALHLSIRNGSDIPQALPDLQLSLFDREEKLLARRRLPPNEYLFPAKTENVAVAAEEVITIDLLFEDPGTRASGFKLEFL